MLEIAKDAVAAGVKEAIVGLVKDGWRQIEGLAITYGDQALISGALFGLIFWGAGSKTGGKVVWWSVVIFALTRIFGAKIYLFVFGLAVAKIVLGRIL